ncbi:MAG: ribonuclease T2 [Pseudolabrys sp.]
MQDGASLAKARSSITVYPSLFLKRSERTVSCRGNRCAMPISDLFSSGTGALMGRLQFSRLAHKATAAFSFILIFGIVAFAQEHRQSEPGQFDYYILALSWSPSYCEARQDRARNRFSDRQCDGRPFSFVVHGLWPQYDRGFPAYCQVPAPRLDRAIVGSMLDLMPSPRLIFHEWDQHGTCSGLSPRTYFENVRKARAAVKIPPEYVRLERPITVGPGEVAEAFLKANPGLSPRAISVFCDRKWLTEVRICLGKDLSVRDCTETRRHACRLDRARMPAVRG